MKRIFFAMLIVLMASPAFAETALLMVDKTTITEGETSREAYVVAGVELTAAGLAGEYNGVDVILADVPEESIEAVKADLAYLGENYQKLFINHPVIAKDVLEVEYVVDGEMKRTKMSAWIAAGSPDGTIKLPVQLAGIASDAEYDSQGAAQ